MLTLRQCFNISFAYYYLHEWIFLCTFACNTLYLHAAFYVYYKDVQTAMKSRSDVRKDTKKRGEKQDNRPI